jgi:glycosyltransferase involved in cell wall biosynthesis
MPERAAGPLIDIVMATKNSARFLPQAIESIARQTNKSHRLIVVDADSTDASGAIAGRHPGAVVLRQRGKGYLDAWNQAIQAGSAPWIAFLDSDDFWTPCKLSLQMAVVERQAELGFVFGRMAFLVEPDARPMGFQQGVLERTHLIPTTGTALVRRSLVERVGLFDERSSIAGDLAWFANLREHCAVGVVEEILLYKRIHASSLGQRTSRALFKQELMAVLKRRVDARRQSEVGP